VQPDRFITLRGIGDLKVDGQTVPELKETLKTAYGRILNDSHHFSRAEGFRETVLHGGTGKSDVPVSTIFVAA